MRKINKKRVAIVIILTLFIIVEIIALGLSKAEVIKEINLSIVDSENILPPEAVVCIAVDDLESGYYIILPEKINNKKILKYLITEKKINVELDVNIDVEEPAEIINIIDKFPEDKIYLTQEELVNESVTLNVVYTKEEVIEEISKPIETIEETIENEVIKEEVIKEEAIENIAPQNITALAVSFQSQNSGIVGNTVYINDLEADFNYYKGLNYVNSSDGKLPSGANQNLYGSSNLVRVQMSYSGTENLTGITNTGTISLTETQSKLVYFNYYPVKNGKIQIQLIDNPFTNRPSGKGFNNWVNNDNTGTISFDTNIYSRYIDIDVEYENGTPKDISLELHASWVDAAVVQKDSSNAWATVFSGLNAKGLQILTNSDKYVEQSMAGFYMQVKLVVGTSLVGYYSSTGAYLSTGTSSNASTIYYKLIQTYDENKIYLSTNSYYYMVTRDTNIVYLTGNVSISWAAAQNKPFTFTGINEGIDYRNNYAWTVSNVSVQIYNDTNIENLKITCGQAGTNGITPPTNNTTSRYLYGNFNNLKIGRGITQSGSNCNFIGVIGGSSTATGSASSLTKYNLIVESGYYSVVINSGHTGTNNMYIDANVIYGNDFDMINNNHSYLDVFYCASGSWGGNIRTTNSIYSGLNLTVKSGSFGSSKYDLSTGIYVGGRGTGAHYLTKSAKIEGGNIYNLIGGPLTDSARNDINDMYIYITGGNIDMITGGAGRSPTYGNRIISLTGGIINYSVFGGSNSSDSTSVATDGTLNGASFIYVGGNSQVGNSNYVLNNTTMFGAESGSVFGAGNGKVGTTFTSLGSCENSNIIIDGNSNILGNIYGGGNYGGTGITGTKSITKTNINVLAGKINGNIYGGGNSNGSGLAAKIATINIEMTGGEVFGSIYGGSNITGTIYGSVNVNVLSGNVNTNVYGGGKGGTSAINTVTQNVSVNIGTNSQNPNIKGSVYGGSAFGIVNGTTANSAATAYNTIVNIENGTIEKSVFGGGQGNATYTPTVLGNITVNINKGNINEVYGGNDQAGTPKGSVKVYLNGGTVGTVFGGNNLGGETITTNISVKGGNITNVYGGGNRANSRNSDVNIENGNIVNIFGGGDAADITYDTKLTITGGNISGNVYGGGEQGAVKGNTNVTISKANIKGSVYAGGDGNTAIVYGNTNVNVHDQAVIGNVDSISPASGCLFGGGNAAATGTNIIDNSTSTVNIAGASIFGNVYGGANTSVVYGNTVVNIGYNAVNNTTLTRSEIYVKGTVFGGGEANASGSEVYDFSFISVTKGININIDGTGHASFKTEGSIFGSGNASSASGTSYINVKNFGNIDSPQKNISIQRANKVTLDNSAISLYGAKDRTNEYSNEFFTLSRIDELILKNNSAIFLNYGANLLKKLSSMLDVNGNEEKAIVTIDESTGNTVKNVDNRVYMREGKNLNIAINEQVTAYGEVNGMFFLGIYTNTLNPSTSNGLYNHNFENSDEITNAGTFASNSYVLGMHKLDHDIFVDGFYTNYDEDGYVKTKYVKTTPEDDLYYIWLVGKDMDVTSFEITLTASKYATLGTYELSLTGFGIANTKFTMSGFSSGLGSDISLINKDEIKSVNEIEEEANSIFGLSMRTGKNGWQTDSNTNFYTKDGGTYSGNNIYNRDNSSYTPTLVFCFYHSENLTVEQPLGEVKVRFQVLTPIDDLNYKLSYVDINITMLTALYQDYFYESSVSPGEEFGLFTTTETSITSKSKFSTYCSLFIDNFSANKHFQDYATAKRVLVSRDANNMPYIFRKNTKITMLDIVTNKYYYYVVNAQDELNNKYIYELANFIEMGSDNQKFEELGVNTIYYNITNNLVYENFIFHVDFKDSNIISSNEGLSLLIQLNDVNNETLLGVLGIQRETAKYSVYTNKDSKIKVRAQVTPNLVYLGNKIDLNVTTDFTQSIVNSKIIYDTQFFGDKMGIKISVFDKNNIQLNIDSLLGIKLILNGQSYYPRVDGSVRINIAQRVSNILSRISIDTSDNKTLATGTYKIKIESFGSPDGICYGSIASDYTEVEVIIINEAYGLKINTDKNSKIIDKVTGKTMNDNNSLESIINYSSGLVNPNISISLERRDYSIAYSLDYDKVNLQDYVTNTLTATVNLYEYELTQNLEDSNRFELLLKENLKTGTYKLKFKLYDKTTFIGESFEYFVIM